MDDSTGNAGANRDIVRIGRPMAEALHWDEAEVAALMAHEMAHAVLDHQTWLAHGGSTRKAEREADRLSVWLLANAGYDPQAAPRWIAKIGPRYQIGFLVSPSHGGWRTRARDMTAEIATMQAARAGSPEAGSQRPDHRRRDHRRRTGPACSAARKAPRDAHRFARRSDGANTRNPLGPWRSHRLMRKTGSHFFTRCSRTVFPWLCCPFAPRRSSATRTARSGGSSLPAGVAPWCCARCRPSPMPSPGRSC
jgi:hypothetical protein